MNLSLSDPHQRLLSALVFAIALAAAVWRAPAPENSGFLLPTEAGSELPASLSQSLIPDSAPADNVSLTQLGDGRIAAAWGNHTAHANIRFSVLGKDGWQKPKIIASRESTAGGTFAHVSRLDAPVLHAEGSWLHLWYAAFFLDHAGGAALHYSRSTDAGQSWSKPEKLQTSPFGQAGTLPHGNPVPLADGGLGLPLSHTFLSAHSVWLRLGPTGRILDKVRLPDTAGSHQPSVVAIDDKTALGLASAAQGTPRLAVSNNGGLFWADGTAPLPPLNRQSPPALLRLKNGRLLLAGNAPDTRGELQLWITDGYGKPWRLARQIEKTADEAADFSHPALLLARDGRIHLAYPWRNRGIRHLSFSDAWLDGDAK